MATRKADRCKVPGCNRPHHARGYCQNCYDDLRKKKRADTVKSHPGDRKKEKPSRHKDDNPKNSAPVQEAGAKGADGRKRATAASPSAKPLEDGQKSTRLGLIKMRHEAMKREIDQIREDLESDEEE